MTTPMIEALTKQLTLIGENPFKIKGSYEGISISTSDELISILPNGHVHVVEREPGESRVLSVDTAETKDVPAASEEVDKETQAMAEEDLDNFLDKLWSS